MSPPAYATAAKQPRTRDATPVIGFAGDDEALVAAVRRGQEPAIAAFYDRFGKHMLRVLGRILGAHRDLADAHHDAFVRALESIGELRDPGALRSWMTSVAVFTARTHLQRQSRRWWLRFHSPDELPELSVVPADQEAREALRSTYRLLDKLPTDERIAFTLRRIDDIDLPSAAAACRMSLATFKRKLARAEKRFAALVASEPNLRVWLEGGGS